VEPKYFQRFNLFERWQHIILFSSITVLVLTGYRSGAGFILSLAGWR
jgi:cytochrome b subunit of formate dehydrogenase